MVKIKKLKNEREREPTGHEEGIIAAAIESHIHKKLGRHVASIRASELNFSRCCYGCNYLVIQQINQLKRTVGKKKIK